jgi:hypothetical protein
MHFLVGIIVIVVTRTFLAGIDHCRENQGGRYRREDLDGVAGQDSIRDFKTRHKGASSWALITELQPKRLGFSLIFIKVKRPNHEKCQKMQAPYKY